MSPSLGSVLPQQSYQVVSSFLSKPCSNSPWHRVPKRWPAGTSPISCLFFNHIHKLLPPHFYLPLCPGYVGTYSLFPGNVNHVSVSHYSREMSIMILIGTLVLVCDSSVVIWKKLVLKESDTIRKVWPYWSRCDLAGGSVSLWRWSLRSCHIRSRYLPVFQTISPCLQVKL